MGVVSRPTAGSPAVGDRHRRGADSASRTSRRCVDLDPATITELDRWRRRLRLDGLPVRSPTTGCSATAPDGSSTPSRSASSSTALVRTHRISRASDSTTSATPTPRCSSPTASPIKVVTERLGHAHPAFTDAHLPAPAPRHERRPPPTSSPNLVAACEPVDVYRLNAPRRTRSTRCVGRSRR